MDCVLCDDFYSLYRGVLTCSRWRKSCYELIRTKLERRPTVIDFPERVCNRLFATYFLDIFNFESQFASVFVSLVDNVTTSTHLPRKDIKYILTTEGPGRVARYDMPLEVPSPVLTDGKLVVGSLDLGPPRDANDLVSSAKELLRYYLVRDAFNIDPSILPLGYVLVNSMGERDSYSLFREDKLSMGILPSNAPKSKQYCGIVPPSQRYFKWLVNQLKGKKFVLLTTLEVNAKGLTVSKMGGITIVTSGVPVERIRQRIEESIPPFPYTTSFMPPFEDMFGRLVEVSVTLPLEWAMPIGECDLGIVSLSFELSYRQMASIADHYAEPVRVKCRRGPYKELGLVVVPISPLDQWRRMMLSTEREHILSLSLSEQRELVYVEERGCNLFNASYATYILSRFGGRGARVLDFSSGWGDRLISAYASSVSKYVHYDPNPELREVYVKQHEACRRASGRDMTREYHSVPFEDEAASYEEGGRYYHAFDLVFTSPPYYDKELYLGEDTSTTRYKTEEEWYEGFFKPAVRAAWNSLVAGGWIALYLPWHPDTNNGVNRMHKEADSVAAEMGAQRKREGADSYMFSLGYVMLQDGKGAPRRTFMWRKK